MIILTDKMLVIPVGISPNYAGAGNSDIKLQTKEVTITENGSKTVVPDENYDGFTKVNITTDVKPSLEDKSVQITENGDYNYTTSAPYYGIGNFNVKVNVEGHYESDKTVNPSFVEDVTVLPSEGFDAMSSVIVKKAVANLQDKTIDKASTSEIVLTADEGYQGLGTVTIAPIHLIEGTITPTSGDSMLSSDTNNNEYIGSVLVRGVPQKTLTADPSTNEQTFNSNHSSGEFYSKVVVNPVTSSIDSNIVPNNIAKGVSILGVTGNLEAGSTPTTPTEAYAIRPTSGRLICPLTNVLLNEKSWVSVDFAMDAASLNKEKACLFGISAASLHCYLNNGVLHMYTGEEVPFNKQITLDTNKHTLEFGFVSKADESGHAEFEVIFDGEMVADVMVLVPTYNAPLSLFDIAGSYYESYDTYLEEGGITHLVNWIGYGVGDSVFDLFSLTVYDKSGYYRQTLHAYTPSVDAGNKPILLDNITGEYQYPASGTYSYAKINGDTRTEIASATYTMPFTNDYQYFRPSDGAIVPTDIELPEHHNIIMYVKDIEDYTVETDTPRMSDEEKRNIIRKKVMIGAQDEMIAPFNHADYERNIQGFEVNAERTTRLADASGGIYYKIDGHDGYSIDSEWGSTPQKLTSFSGEHIIKCGVKSSGTSDVWKSTSIDSSKESLYLWNGIAPGRLNEFKFAPLCIFGTYNLDESLTTDDVIALGYQEALNQIGYKTGVRYAVKQIDIEECYVDHNEGNIFDNKRLKHRLVPNTDNNSVNCLFDTITGTSYYPYNGTLDLYTGPVEPEPEPPIVPDVSILTDTYIKPSAHAIVPTDIKHTAYTVITMDIKDIDNFDEELGSDVTGEAALNVVKSRVMIGAQPHTIAPFNHLDYERSLPDLEINDENTRYLGDSSIGLFFGFGQDGGYKRYSIRAEYGGTPGAAIPSLTGEHTIEIGLWPRHDYWMDPGTYFLQNYFIIDNQPESSQLTSPITNPFDWFNNATKAPICIFGTYNLDENKTPDDIIALGYENALKELGYTAGVRFAVKKIDIKQYNIERILTEKYSLVPAKDKDGVICLYDEVNNKSYYPYYGTLDVYNGSVEPAPTLLTGSYVKPSAGAIVPTDIKLTSLTNVIMHVKGFDNFEGITDFDSRAMIGSQPNLILSPFNRNDAEKGLPITGVPTPQVPSADKLALLSDSSIGLYYNGCGNIYNSINRTPQILTMDGEHVITVGYDPLQIDKINMDTDRAVHKILSVDEQRKSNVIVGDAAPVYQLIDDQMKTPICIFGNYNNPESMTPDDVIALGYENALTQIGYVTGARYGVKQIDIDVRNADGSMTTTHSLVPARDSSNVNCLYDTITEKSYYPFHGTLDII